MLYRQNQEASVAGRIGDLAVPLALDDLKYHIGYSEAFWSHLGVDEIESTVRKCLGSRGIHEAWQWSCDKGNTEAVRLHDNRDNIGKIIKY